MNVVHGSFIGKKFLGKVESHPMVKEVEVEGRAEGEEEGGAGEQETTGAIVSEGKQVHVGMEPSKTNQTGCK